MSPGLGLRNCLMLAQRRRDAEKGAVLCVPASLREHYRAFSKGIIDAPRLPGLKWYVP